MGSLIGELEARRAAVQARVEELEGQINELTTRLEAERSQLERLTVTARRWMSSRPRVWPSTRSSRRRGKR
jgi:uncharacterized coiled-coil protein SlyX